MFCQLTDELTDHSDIQIVAHRKGVTNHTQILM